MGGFKKQIVRSSWGCCSSLGNILLSKVNQRSCIVLNGEMWNVLPISDRRAHKRMVTFLCDLGRNNEGFKSKYVAKFIKEETT